MKSTIASLIANKCEIKSVESVNAIAKDWLGKPQAPKKDAK